jgi:hypothetical protein
VESGYQSCRITRERGRERTVQLTVQQAKALLAKHRVYAREICDKCGAVLGAVRFTRKCEAGEWCSRECRDGKDAHEPRTCKGCRAKLTNGKRRGAEYCDDACRKAHERSSYHKLSRTKGSIYAAFSPKKTWGGVRSHPKDFSCVLGQIGCEA